jgi:hypothetical protein
LTFKMILMIRVEKLEILILKKIMMKNKNNSLNMKMMSTQIKT